MTPSTPSNQGPGQIPPPEQQPPYPQYNGHQEYAPTSYPQQPQKKQLNALGLIALITAVIGFIFACIPGALIIGWVLLPIAFVLGLVSVFLKDKSKWMGIAAVILSIVGTVVGVVVFLAVVADAFDDSFGSGETTVAAPSEGAADDNKQESESMSETDSDTEPATEGEAEEEGTRADPYPMGSVIKNDEWSVVVNSVTLDATDAVMEENEFSDPPADGSQYMLVNYSVTYEGDDPDGDIPAMVQVEYVTAEGTTVRDYDSFVVTPDSMDSSSTLYTGGTETGNVSFEVPSDTADQGVLAITPGVLEDKVFVDVK